MRYLVITSIRNEGPFIVEWVVWQKLLGFTDILVVTNDCTDHSADILGPLQKAGWLVHVDHAVPAGSSPLRVKMRRAKRHRLVAAADWILVCDIDEFLVVHRGGGRVQDLLGPDGPDCLGMSVNWKVFGTSGHRFWSDGIVHRQFTRCAPAGHNVNRWFKAFFRHPEWFDRFNVHGPEGLDLAAAGRDWGSPGMVWVNSDGLPVPDWQPGGAYQRLTAAELTTHRAAQINHYMIRSSESFGLKRGSLSAVAMKDRYTDDFLARFNRNEATDLGALKYGAAFDRLLHRALAVPGVWKAHHLCCADYVARLMEKAGTDPAADPRRHHHMALAASA